MNNCSRGKQVKRPLIRFRKGKNILRAWSSFHHFSISPTLVPGALLQPCLKAGSLRGSQILRLGPGGKPLFFPPFIGVLTPPPNKGNQASSFGRLGQVPQFCGTRIPDSRAWMASGESQRSRCWQRPRTDDKGVPGNHRCLFRLTCLEITSWDCSR